MSRTFDMPQKGSTQKFHKVFVTGDPVADTELATKHYVDNSGGGGGGGSNWTKITKTHTDFSVADVTSTINLMSLPAKTIIEDIIIFITQAFDDGSGNAPGVDGLGIESDHYYFFNYNENGADHNSQVSPLSYIGQFRASGGNSGGPVNSLLGGIKNSTLTHGGSVISDLNGIQELNITLFSANVNFDTFIQGAISIYIKTDLLP